MAEVCELCADTGTIDMPGWFPERDCPECEREAFRRKLLKRLKNELGFSRETLEMYVDDLLRDYPWEVQS